MAWERAEARSLAEGRYSTARGERDAASALVEEIRAALAHEVVIALMDPPDAVEVAGRTLPLGDHLVDDVVVWIDGNARRAVVEDLSPGWREEQWPRIKDKEGNVTELEVSAGLLERRFASRRHDDAAAHILAELRRIASGREA
jgi:hypothetical protein